MPTIIRVYDTYSDADHVVREIEAVLPSSEISLIANRDVREEFADVEQVAGTGAGVGAAIGGGGGLLAGLGLLAIPGLGPVVAAGWLASTAVCALAGATAGGLIGALAGTGISEEDANIYAEIVRRGGTLVSVRTEGHLQAKVLEIMDRYGPISVNERRAQYALSGWSRFDPTAKS